MTRMLVRRSVAFLLLACGWASGAAASDRRTVVVLYSEQFLGPSTTAFTQGLREGLAFSPPTSVEAQYLDISQFAGEAHDRALADWLSTRYRDRRLTWIVALGVPASVFATRYGDAIWPGARILHTAIDGNQVRAGAERGDLVLPRRFEYRRTVEHALQIWPDVHTVFLVAGATDQDRRWLSVAEADLAPLTDRVRVERIADLRWDDELAKVKRMPGDSIAVGVLFGGDADGRQFVVGDALLDLARAANRPFFVVASPYIGTGAIGGYVLDSAEIGRLAAKVVLGAQDKPDVVNGLLTASTNRWMFDAAQLRRWNIPEAKLPAGSLVLNRELPAWRQYLWALLAAALLVAAQGAIIGALLVQRRNRRRV